MKDKSPEKKRISTKEKDVISQMSDYQQQFRVIFSHFCLPTLSADLFIYVIFYRFAEFLISTCTHMFSPSFHDIDLEVLGDKQLSFQAC